MKTMVRAFQKITALLMLVALSACGTPQVSQGINDPFEEKNRRVHEFNKSLDSTFKGKRETKREGPPIPKPILQTVVNVSSNLATPGYIVNDVLQGNGDDFRQNMTRFLINSTFGFLGLYDLASELGIYEASSDFGETLHVWGVKEGAYVELPFAGPSTQRDVAGKVVDVFTNPLRYVLPTPESYALPVASVLGGVSTRMIYGDTIDSILYDSADSYAQARLLYLEKRRFELGGVSAPTEGEVDPYADPTGIDPYAD